MIKKIVLFLLIAVSFSFYVKRKSFIPPGTVQITEQFFADKAEITNFAWWEYEIWAKTKYGKNSKEHLGVLPDTMAWKTCFNEAYASIYYRHPSFRNHPVVGVSYEQALAFCKWRTERVKEFLYLGSKKEFNFEYRLPTKNEWELLSSNGVEVFYKKNSVECLKNTKDQKIYQLNYKANCFINDSVSQFKFTTPVSSYTKNRFNMYDMIGNVAEMIADKGVSKGGSWCNTLEECRVGKDIPYSKPEAWLGFRCVCEMK